MGKDVENGWRMMETSGKNWMGWMVSPILLGGDWNHRNHGMDFMKWIMTFPCWECHHHWSIISTWRIFQASDLIRFLGKV